MEKACKISGVSNHFFICIHDCLSFKTEGFANLCVSVFWKANANYSLFRIYFMGRYGKYGILSFVCHDVSEYIGHMERMCTNIAYCVYG